MLGRILPDFPAGGIWTVVISVNPLRSCFAPMTALIFHDVLLGDRVVLSVLHTLFETQRFSPYFSASFAIGNLCKSLADRSVPSKPAA